MYKFSISQPGGGNSIATTSASNKRYSTLYMTRRFKRILTIALCGFLFIWGCEELTRRVLGGFAGSFPFAESWELDYKEPEIIAAIKDLKIEDKNLQPPNQTELTFGKGKISPEDSLNIARYKHYLKADSGKTSHQFDDVASIDNNYWYYIDFYYPDTKEIVHTWTRPTKDSISAIFALVGFSKLSDSNSYRYINKDFWYIENKIQINKFKNNIIDRIKRKIWEKRKRGAQSGRRPPNNVHTGVAYTG